MLYQQNNFINVELIGSEEKLFNLSFSKGLL